MSLRVCNTVEKNTSAIETAPIVLPANAQYVRPGEIPGTTASPVLFSLHGYVGEISARRIQNCDTTGTIPVYYKYGNKCDTTNYNGIIFPGQQLDCSDCGDALFCYATAQVTVATTVIRREDLHVPGVNIINQNRG